MSAKRFRSSAFRSIALALPEAVEGSHQGHADFRAGKRVFATLGYPDDDWGMVKLTPEQQSVLVAAEPDIFRPVPGGWGKHGSTNVRLARADAATLQSALKMAWRNVAPKLLIEVLENRSVDFLHRINLLRLRIAHFFRTTVEAYSRSIMRFVAPR